MHRWHLANVLHFSRQPKFILAAKTAPHLSRYLRCVDLNRQVFNCAAVSSMRGAPVVVLIPKCWTRSSRSPKTIPGGWVGGPVACRPVPGSADHGAARCFLTSLLSDARCMPHRRAASLIFPIARNNAPTTYCRSTLSTASRLASRSD